ncbi:ribosome hibernation-promoting factor, HPF/YfiA family [Methylobacterium sp. CM6257]|jgi:ribosomal subunit interface protein
MISENITVGSAHLDLGESFREQAQQRIREAANKYLGNLVAASVHVAREGGDFRCSVNMQMSGQEMMSAEAVAESVPLAFRTALNKVEKQLRRTKRLQREDRAHQPDRIITA